ncbi:putative thiamine-phosphate kinase [Leptospira broomii serovar Hurstbridge str. 5399]|uniref:Thiamine-monophosphate kinase n=1 Tax=Leptospira broomii serovar Hurstbridge str. 5399 TaxID=1049789 RepID=T0FAI1_9LEPT|nr:thiamine-phosphate kinase [Leptospira broomii]EQA44547.1 putative thiamine-phosphate kinase [Leptospira broomii serovar Hurstbridge str. 5399]
MIPERAEVKVFRRGQESDLNEEELISSLYPPGKEQESDCYLGTDGCLITTDTIVEGTHFRLDWSSPADLARKLIEVNVSDIAAANGVPKKAFFNFGLSPSCNRKEFLNPFVQTFKETLYSYGIELCGGDTYRSQELNLTLTLLGKSDSPVSRKGGRAGDRVYLTGHIGASLLGYKILDGSNPSLPPGLREASIDRHLRPRSRLSLSRSLYSSYNIHAGMDLTDGLIQDLGKLAKVSRLVIEIELNRVPVLDGIEKAIGLEGILSSGEELELLFLSPDLIPSQWESVDITPIGSVRFTKENESPRVDFLLNEQLFRPTEGGFRHFT